LGLELSNATLSIYWIFALLFDEAHNPKVVSSNLSPATNRVTMQQGLPDLYREPLLLLRANVIQFVTAKITS